MLSGSDDSSLKMWDLRQGHLLYTLLGHQGSVNAVKYNPSGDNIASAGADNQVMYWKGLTSSKANNENKKSVLKAKEENSRTERISEQLSGTLDKLVNQLDMITRTMIMLDQRVSGFEEHIAKLTEKVMRNN